MTAPDVPGAAEIWYEAFWALRAQLGLPALPRTPADDERLERRLGHLIGSDPDGSWVAEEDGRVTGLAQAFIRDGIWVLSLLGVSPEHQGRGTARLLLEQALDYGTPGAPGMIQASADPKAMALYAGAGFALHPSVAAWGPVRSPIVAPRGVRAGGAGDLEVVDAVDRELKDATRGDLIAHLLSSGDHRLLVDGTTGYAVVKGDRVVTLGALDEESASRLLLAAMAGVPPGEPFQMNWVTADQQWAVRDLVAAGVPLHPAGPVMVRSLVGPFSPYIPSGGLG
ncbi:MAG: GNAT family N-acetyltransferase [Acidimicrobiales bacterium]